METIKAMSSVTTIKKNFRFFDIVRFINHNDDIWIHNGYHSHYNNTMNLIGVNNTTKESMVFPIELKHFGIPVWADVIGIIFDYNSETLTIKYKLYGGK